MMDTDGVSLIPDRMRKIRYLQALPVLWQLYRKGLEVTVDDSREDKETS